MAEEQWWRTGSGEIEWTGSATDDDEDDDEDDGGLEPDCGGPGRGMMPQLLIVVLIVVLKVRLLV